MRNVRTFVAGHRGMVGASLCRSLAREGAALIVSNRSQTDLRDFTAVVQLLDVEKPDIVIIAAAKVGGILANSTYQVEFLLDNLKIAINIIEAAYQLGVKRLLFLGSTCIYPRDCPQPITEDSLLSGPLETTNEAYALAKIAGLKLCQYYRKQYGALFHSAMPTNLYGPGDNYHPDQSHVLPALIRRFHVAKLEGAPSVSIWGSGTPLREFLHVDDLADAVVHLVQLDNPPDWVNIGSGDEISILGLGRLVAEVVGYNGEIICDRSKPDGTPRKLTDTSLLRSLGWQSRISLRDGLHSAYQSFLEEMETGQLRSSDTPSRSPSHLGT